MTIEKESSAHLRSYENTFYINISRYSLKHLKYIISIRGVRSSKRVPWLWHLTALVVRLILGLWGIRSNFSVAITPKSTLYQSGSICYIIWLILMVCQFVLGYFIPRGYGIMFIYVIWRDKSYTHITHLYRNKIYQSQTSI